jgi:sterol carrier protein 2
MIPFNEASIEVENSILAPNKGPMVARLFGNGATEYFQKFGGGIEHLAQIGKWLMGMYLSSYNL